MFNGYKMEDKAIQVTFSDPLRREGIEGDKEGYELTESTCRTLLITMS